MKQFILVLVLTISGYAYGQDCNYIFLGELTDFHDGTPISVATIFIQEQNQERC